MTREQITRRKKVAELNRLRKRAADAPHGRKKQRMAELRAWIKADLAGESQMLGGVRG